MLTFTDTYTYTPRYQELDFWQEDQLLFDIETTGLSAKYNTIYLIGCAYHKGSEITLLQYLAETPAEESEVLEAFLELCKDFQGLLSFNGIRFDERFILEDGEYEIQAGSSLTAVRNCKSLPTLCPISILTSIRHAAA